MQTDTLILTGDGYGLAIAPEAEALKLLLLKDSALIVEVIDVNGSNAARAQIKELASIRNQVEKCRTQIKAPVIAIGRLIDQKGKDFLAELDAAEKRLVRLVERYAEKVEADRRAAEVERQRIEREAERQRQEAERQRLAEIAAREQAEREAEAARIAAEKAAAQADDDDIDAQIEAARANDEANARRKQAEEQEKADRAAEGAREAASEQLAEQQRRASLTARQGTFGVKFSTEFEVEDIHALYAYSSGLISMTVKTMETKRLIAQLESQGGGTLPTVPGLRIYRKPVVATR